MTRMAREAADDDVVGRVPRIGVERGRGRDEREGGFDGGRFVAREGCPFDGRTDVPFLGRVRRASCLAVFDDAYEFAGFVEDAAIAVVRAGFDRAFDEEEPDGAVWLDVDVENRTAHRDRGRRGLDLVGRFGGDAGDKAERALHQVDDDGAVGFFRVVDEFVERHARAGAEGEFGVVLEFQFAQAVFADFDDFFLADGVVFGELATVGFIGGGDVVFDRDGRADGVAGGCLRRGQDGGCQAKG